MESKLSDVTLLEVLERLLEKGIAIQGDLLIALADVELIYLGLKIVITSTEKTGSRRNSGIEHQSNKFL